jgi:hypothetical protein
MCIQKGINRIRVDNYLDSQEGDQLVDQVVVDRIYWGDGEQLSHVEAGGIRLVQDARTREYVV